MFKTPAIQKLVEDIQSLPRICATESLHADQTTELCSEWYDTIVFYRHKSYSAAAAVSMYQCPTNRASHVPTLYYNVMHMAHEPNIDKLNVTGARLIFINVLYTNSIRMILVPLAREVISTSGGDVESMVGIIKTLNPAPKIPTTCSRVLTMIAARENKVKCVDIPVDTRWVCPWWVPYHISMEHKEFDDAKTAQYSAYINVIGGPNVMTFDRVSAIAPHAFFEEAAAVYKNVANTVGIMCKEARRAQFGAYTIYVSSDCPMRNFVAHWLFKLPDCDFVMLIKPMNNYTGVMICFRGSPKKQINVGDIARSLGGHGDANVGMAYRDGSITELVTFG